MAGNLYEASKQWATRPQDERFANVAELTEYVVNRNAQSVEYTATIDVEHRDGMLLLDDGTGNEYALTNWTFNQLCRRADAPADYLRKLPTQKVSELLSYGLRKNNTRDNLIYVCNGTRVVRAITSERYSRVADNVILDILNVARDRGFVNPPAYEVNGTRNAGLYASDRDIFGFMVNENARIVDPTNSNNGLAPGFFIYNSEVGARVFGGACFLYRYICGNHIIWGAENVSRFSKRHVGRMEEYIYAFAGAMISAWGSTDRLNAEQSLATLAHKNIAVNRDKLLATVNKWEPTLGKKNAELAYNYAEAYRDQDGDPLTYFGYANGLTRMAHGEFSTVDRRNEVELIAQSILVRGM